MEDEPGGMMARLAARSGWLIGAAGLVAWIALLWFMVGDVL